MDNLHSAPGEHPGHTPPVFDRSCKGYVDDNPHHALPFFHAQEILQIASLVVPHLLPRDDPREKEDVDVF